MPKVIALCAPVTDYLVHIDRLPEINAAEQINRQYWSYGGNAATAIVSVARQGVSAGIMGLVGNDHNGLCNVGDFIRNGVDTSALTVADGQSSAYAVCLVAQETASRSFLIAPPSRTLLPEEIDYEYLGTADYLNLDSNTPATTAAAKFMLQKGGQVVYDAGLYLPNIEEIIPHTTIFIASEFYLYKRYGSDADVFAACEDITELGPHTVIFTLGDKGCAGIGPEGRFSLPCFPVDDVVDTTGCGDTFHGSYSVAHSRGLSTLECARWSSAASAIKCTAMTGRAAQATSEIITGFLETGIMDTSFVAERLEYYSKPHYIFQPE